jgi:hypothetical protein
MDVFTHDALAWTLVSAGRLDEAQIEMNLALAQGTQDARLFLHAATLAHKNGRLEAAEHFTARAGQFKHTLLPSERVHLATLRGELAILGSTPRFTSINK